MEILRIQVNYLVIRLCFPIVQSTIMNHQKSTLISLSTSDSTENKITDNIYSFEKHTGTLTLKRKIFDVYMTEIINIIGYISFL